jgi:hypothetical protein
MLARRPAWCPRCDELRPGRPGTPCPTCRAPLLRPSATTADPTPRRTVQPGRGWPRARAGFRLARPWLAGLALLAVVAAGFAAGRAGAPAPAPAQAPPPPSTSPPPAQPPSEASFDWTSRPAAGLTLTLRTIRVETGEGAGSHSEIGIDVAGVPSGTRVSAIAGVRLLDRHARQLLAVPEQEPGGATTPDQAGLASLRLFAAPLADPTAVAQVDVATVTLARDEVSTIQGSVTDPNLLRNQDGSLSPRDQPPAGCPRCRVRLACQRCTLVRVAGSAYRHGTVIVLLRGTDPAARPAPLFRDGGPAEVSSDDGGRVDDWSDTLADGTTVVGFDAGQLTDRAGRGQPYRFTIVAHAEVASDHRGGWTMRGQGGGA